ncbi:hypothetical protein J1N35_016590 [Gossypium stocksii]|uniref:Uncharacterized protein n=1 Tax=Gossypium stocksii TaxID=47602 RepID=A0A9D4A4X8_9ROSI|nr:hypothetical protein J1N35_016590 [Gossypium stocksii]
MQSTMLDHLFSSFLWLLRVVQTWEEQGGEVGFEGSSGNGHEAFLEGSNDLFGVVLALEAAVVAFVVLWRSDNRFERSIAAPSIWNRQFDTSMDRWLPNS